MKIDPNMVIGGINAGRPVSGTKGVSGTSFEDLLKGVEQSSAQPLSGMQGISSVDMLSPQKVMALSLSDQSIGLLEDYMSALKDPAFNLNDLAKKVDEMASMQADLANAAVAVSPDDPLKEIMDELSGSLSSEIMRFKRGDLAG